MAALNEALNGEVQRLKLAIGESSHSNEADRSKMQSLNAEMFQQLNISQLRQEPQSQQNPNGTMSAKWTSRPGVEVLAGSKDWSCISTRQTVYIFFFIYVQCVELLCILQMKSSYISDHGRYIMWL